MLSDIRDKQKTAVKILTAHLERERMAHAYLFCGEISSGKEDLALAFSKSLNCSRRSFFEACECGNCRKIESRNHPDVSWIGEDPKSNSIKIEEVRGIIRSAGLKPYEGIRKVFIILDAERLTPDASNAILKTLEEPPPDTILLLLVKSAEHLLETIRSRTFKIRLQPLKDKGTESSAEIYKTLNDMERRKWEDLTGPYQTSPRDEAKSLMNDLMAFFYERLHGFQGNAGNRTQPWIAGLEALDCVQETQEALMANANQKLALTRLSMRLRKIHERIR